MQATYIGSPDDPQTQEVSQHGLTFRRGEAIDIGGLTEFQIHKLKGNPTFDVTDDAAPKKKGKDKPADPLPAIPDDIDSLDDVALRELANAIDPTLGEDVTREVSVDTIEAELGRRAAAKPAA